MNKDNIFQFLLLAYNDDILWKNLKIPSRLKLELKTYFLSSNYGPDRGGVCDDTASIFNIVSDDTVEIVYQIGNQIFDIDKGPTLSSLSTKTVSISTEKEEKTVWMKCYSHVHNHSYYYNSITHESLWECPDEVGYLTLSFKQYILNLRFIKTIIIFIFVRIQQQQQLVTISKSRIKDHVRPFIRTN